MPYYYAMCMSLLVRFAYHLLTPFLVVVSFQGGRVLRDAYNIN